MLFEQD